MGNENSFFELSSRARGASLVTDTEKENFRLVSVFQSFSVREGKIDLYFFGNRCTRWTDCHEIVRFDSRLLTFGARRGSKSLQSFPVISFTGKGSYTETERGRRGGTGGGRRRPVGVTFSYSGAASFDGFGVCDVPSSSGRCPCLCRKSNQEKISGFLEGNSNPSHRLFACYGRAQDTGQRMKKSL